MKTKITLLLSLVLFLAACTDSSAVRDVKGAYRYKTTGKVTLEENFKGATKADTLVANLDNESGTLEVISLHDGDSLLLTIDQLNGNVTVTRGAVSDSRLHFAPYNRTIEIPTTIKHYDTLSIDLGIISKDTVIVREQREYEPYDITVRGYAEVYDNNLVFNLSYSGKSQTTERTLRGTGFRSLAKKN
ncbi:MAG: hypothetical protein IJT12_01550 [Paludibacteraceae bacterium]|nr:hypothetical protein [Paludibacteraceae bacterium]